MNSRPPRADRIASGVPGLDRLLRGGLPRTALYAIKGRPGAGKSILAHQIASQHIRDGGKVLYLTALTESHQTLIAQARTFRFFDASVIPDRLYYSSLYPTLERGGLQSVGEQIRTLISHQKPTLVVIDGLQVLRYAAATRVDYHRWLHGLEAQAAGSGTTTLLLTSQGRSAATDPALTTVDGVIALKAVAQQLRKVRLVCVEKMRGLDHFSGWHTAEITEEGLLVYPRLEAVIAAEGLPPQVPKIERFAFMAKGLTEMMGGGVTSSSATFIIGTPGSGKTFLGMAFLSEAIRHQQPTLFLGFHETPDRLLLKTDAIGLPLRQGVKSGLVALHWQPASEMLSDEVAERLLRLIDARGIRRLMLDGYDQFMRGARTGDRGTEFFSAFCDLLRARGVASVLTADLGRIVGESLDLPITGELSPIIDNIIHLRSTEFKGEFRRLIAILKVRDQEYDRGIREFHVTKSGIKVGRVVREGEGLLTGLARRKR
jgi:circadian clock protein KaiC